MTALWRRLVPETAFHQNRYANQLARRVRPGTRWLDVGAGSSMHDGWIGPTPEELRRRAGVLIGCDLSPDSLLQNEDVDVKIAADAKSLPFRSDYFDLVTSNMVLEHLPEPLPVFHEVYRVLRPGGCFLSVTPNVLHPVIFVANLFLTKPLRRAIAHRFEGRRLDDIYPTYYRANTIGKISQIAKSSNFTQEMVSAFFSTPLIRSAGPLTLLEATAVRLSPDFISQRVGSNIIAALKKN